MVEPFLESPFFQSRPITDDFGAGGDPSGIDLRTRTHPNEPVLASDGVVEIVRRWSLRDVNPCLDGRSGNAYRIRSFWNPRYSYVVAHLAEDPIYSVGDVVHSRQPLGLPGNTGGVCVRGDPTRTVVLAPHLHYGVFDNELRRFVDPKPFMKPPAPPGTHPNDAVFWPDLIPGQPTADVQIDEPSAASTGGLWLLFLGGAGCYLWRKGP